MKTILVMYDRGLLVHNVTFINFLHNQTPAIFGPTSNYIFLRNQTKYILGWLTKFSSMSFVNVTLRGRFQWPYESLYEDQDGTLTGLNQSMVIMPPDGLTNLSPSCSPSIDFANAVQCSLMDGPWVRIWIQEYPFNISNYFNTSLQIKNQLNHTTNVSRIHLSEYRRNGYLFTLQVNQTYQLSLMYQQVSQIHSTCYLRQSSISFR